MIEKILVSKFISEVYDYLKSKALDKKARLEVSKKDFENAIFHHTSFVKNWASDVQFRDMENPKPLEKVYIDLDFYITPLKVQYFEQNRDSSIKLDEIFKSQERHLIILGQPGAGKTTSMKHICQRLLYDEEFYPKKFKFPIAIRLRELGLEGYYSLKTQRVSLIQKIYNILGISISFKDKENVFRNETLIRKLVVETLEQMQVMIVLDGFDEIEDSDDKESILNDIRYLTLHLNNSRIILTSRSGDFVYQIDNTAIYEICPLNEEQINNFCIKWLEDENRAKSLQKQIKNSPFADTTLRPLTLAHLCAIYDKYDKIPDKPKTVYRKIVNLFLEEWDLQRSIKRVSQYGNFEIDRKFEFLTNLAFFLTSASQKTVFTIDELQNTYTHIAINFELPIEEVNQVINELEAHNGLFQQTGQDSYEFAHKSIQEYLSAEYLVKLPSIPESKSLLLNIPNELALAVSISSSSTIYLSLVILQHLEDDIVKEGFLESFLSRLIIEKPDFSPHPILGLTFLQIQSLVIENHKIDSTRKIKILDLLDEIFKIKNVSYSLGGLKRYYDDKKINKPGFINLEKVETLANLPEKYQPEILTIEEKLWI